MISNIIKMLRDMIQGPTDALENVGTINALINCAEEMEKQMSTGSPIYAVLDIVEKVCYATKGFREKVL